MLHTSRFSTSALVRLLGAAGAAAIAVGLPAASFAATINFATGQNASGTIQTTGDALDADWNGSNAPMPQNGANMYVVAPGESDWDQAWSANGPNSSWIAPNPTIGNANGNFSATYTFTLAAADASTASFTGGRFIADDGGTVTLNGHLLVTQNFGDWTNGFTSFTIPDADLLAGTNTLVVQLQNSDDMMQAMRLEGTLVTAGITAGVTAGTASSSGGGTGVPGPGALGLLGAGLVGLGFARRVPRQARIKT